MNKPYPITRILAIVLIIVLLAGWLPLNSSSAMVSFDNPATTPTPPQVIPPNKIDPNVMRLLQERPGEKVSIIVYMAKQADLSQQALPKGPAVENIDQQCEAVFQTLTQTAANTQGPVISVLQGTLGGVHGVQSSDIESFWIFNGLGATADRDTILKLAALPEVRYIYEDVKITIPPEELQSDEISSTVGGETALPWNLTRIQADRAWNELGYNGKGVVVGIIDTGVDPNHPALKSKYRGNHTYQVYSWHDFVDSSKLRPYDDQGHGTHVAGIILGDDGAGNITGVAPGVEWIAAKAIDAHGQGFSRALMSAMQWMLAPEGVPSLAPDVVNSSWGGPCGSEYFRVALESYRSAGIVPIFAAGNYGPASKSMAQPACLPEAISVGAIDENNTVASFSSRGPSPYGETKPELSAPGVNIRSTFPNGLYAIKKGTSMAAPHVTGVVALIRQAYPNILVDDIEKLLLNKAVDLGPAGLDNDYGWGRVDAYRALGGSVVEQPPGEVTPVAPSGNVSGRQPTFTWNAVSGAASYQLKIDALAGETTTTTHQAAEVCSGTTCSFKIASPLGGWAYTWQVRASNSAGDGPWSDTMSFTVSDGPSLPAATLVSPQGTISETQPVYQWNPANGATRYLLKVNSTSAAIIQNWYQSTDICSASACSARPSTKVTAGSYTWRVQTSNASSDGPWSDFLSFTVNSPTQPTPTLTPTLKPPTPTSTSIPPSTPTYTPTPTPTSTSTSVATPVATPANYDTYIVQPGDYLAKLARRWGVNWLDIATLNNIQYPYIIYVGQTLKIPPSGVQPTPISPPTSTPLPPGPTPVQPTPVTPNPGSETYTVQPGDYLAKLAQQWGVSWIEIATLNNIHYPYIIYVGQVLKKPGSSTPPTPGQPPIPTATPVPNSGQTYIVQPGDYLAKLAQQWGVSWQQIAALNNIYYPYIIYVGQVLKRP